MGVKSQDAALPTSLQKAKIVKKKKQVQTIPHSLLRDDTS